MSDYKPNKNNTQSDEGQEESGDQSDGVLSDEDIVKKGILKGKGDWAAAISRMRDQGLLNKRIEEGKTALMLAAENGKLDIVTHLISAGAKVDIHLDKERETALTLVREERVLVRLAQSAGLSQIKPEHEEEIRKYLAEKGSSSEIDPIDYISMFKEILRKDNKYIPADDLIKIGMEFKKQEVSKYEEIRVRLLNAGGYNVKKILHQDTRKKVREILLNTKESALTEIVKKQYHGTDAVFTMLDLLAENESFKHWPSLLPYLPNIFDDSKNSVLHCLAKAGNVSALHTLLKPPDKEDNTLKDFYGKQNRDNNTFLHVYAQKNNLRALFSSEITLDGSLAHTLKVRNNEGKTFMAIAINNVSEDAKDKQEDDEALCEVMDKIAKMYGETTVSSLCKRKDMKRNNLLHSACQKSLKRLVVYLLPRTIDLNDASATNQDGLNLLHVAVYKNDAELIHTILNTEVQNKVEVDGRTSYGETALHIAAKQGYLNVLEELIKHGGDLSAQDRDGHTPLHDCLQQVYFEGGDEEEGKCEKFIKVWNKVVEQAVTWWCMKQKELNDEDKYMSSQRKAVYYLRSCIPNKDGLSVLQYAADRGLVRCVHTMLATKAVFAIGDKGNKPANEGQKSRDIQERNDDDSSSEAEEDSAHDLESDFNFKIDVTNLFPEYHVPFEKLYSKTERDNLDTLSKAAEDNNTSRSKKKKLPRNASSRGSRKMKYSAVESGDQKEDPKASTFIDALVKMESSNKAGEILELTPMITLTKLQWSVFQWFSIAWLVIHMSLMVYMTHQSHREVTTRNKHVDIPILIYATFIFVTHIMVRIIRWRTHRRQDNQTQEHEVKNNIFVRIIRWITLEREVKKDDYGLFNVFTTAVNYLFDQMDLIVEFAFFGFAWAIFGSALTDVENDTYAWIKGFCLLFGWLILLIPLRSYSPVYKLISVLKHITIADMFPWILLYITISSGFASAIQLQFQLLPGNVTCMGEEHELKEVLHHAGNALFELAIMTTGLDTDLKHVRNLACLFEYNNKSVHIILLLVTFYAVISAVVLLNMLIAIMSNTVTTVQHSKGWRQYQVYQALCLYKVISKIQQCCTCLCSKKYQNNPERGSNNRDGDSSNPEAIRNISKEGQGSSEESPNSSDGGQNSPEGDSNNPKGSSNSPKRSSNAPVGNQQDLEVSQKKLKGGYLEELIRWTPCSNKFNYDEKVNRCYLTLGHAEVKEVTPLYGNKLKTKTRFVTRSFFLLSKFSNDNYF